MSRGGLVVTGQRVEPQAAVLECRVAVSDTWCRVCGCEGMPRGSVRRELAHVPFGGRPTRLVVRVRRFKCTRCGRIWRENTDHMAIQRTKLSTGALSWALFALVCQRMSISAIAKALGTAWNTVNDALLEAGQRALIDDPKRFDDVAVIGVDEHCWKNARGGERFVTVIIDLTPVRNRTGPARLLDITLGRSKQVFVTWLKQQTPGFRTGVEVVAMVPRKREVPPGFTGFKTATQEHLSQATAVLDPFHVVALVG